MEVTLTLSFNNTIKIFQIKPLIHFHVKKKKNYTIKFTELHEMYTISQETCCEPFHIYDLPLEFEEAQHTQLRLRLSSQHCITSCLKHSFKTQIIENKQGIKYQNCACAYNRVSHTLHVLRSLLSSFKNPAVAKSFQRMATFTDLFKIFFSIFTHCPSFWLVMVPSAGVTKIIESLVCAFSLKTTVQTKAW